MLYIILKEMECRPSLDASCPERELLFLCNKYASASIVTL